MSEDKWISKQGKLEFLENEIKDTSWRTEGKVLVGGLITALVIGIGITVYFLWKKQQQYN